MGCSVLLPFDGYIIELLAQNSAQSTSTSLPDLNDQQGNIFEDLDDTNMQNVVEKDINAENMKDFPDLNILNEIEEPPAETATPNFVPFIKALENASLDNPCEQLDTDMLNTIRNPPQEQLSIKNLFLAMGNASEDTYNRVRNAVKRRHPDDDILSFYQVKKLVTELTGISPLTHEMCINSCMGYTGPFALNTTCHYCSEEHYYTNSNGKQVAKKQFNTIPLAPQIQALWRTTDSAKNLCYRENYTNQVLDELSKSSGHRNNKSIFRDFFDGKDYLDAVLDKRIKPGDMTLLLSIDVSECWIYIWKHVLIGGFIPGPNKPKNIDNANRNITFLSHPFFALATADGPAMACINGFVGHQGKNSSQYYPLLQKPTDYIVADCDHNDRNLTELLMEFTSKKSVEQYNENLKYVGESENPTDFKRRWLNTGICKPTILSSLSPKHRLAIPLCFPLDLMHLPALNIPDLFIPLWRGTFEYDKTDSRDSWDWVVLKGDVWKEHGKQVADITPYIPGSFDRPPRNPAEKINSGYKAWEFLLYFFGLGPSYYKNYTKCVCGILVLLQENISFPELKESNKLLISFINEFETLYIQCRADHIHMARPSMHAIANIACETERWTIERTIGNLGEEMKQHSNPFANISERGLQKSLKSGAQNLGEGYVLQGKENSSYSIDPCEQAALRTYLENTGANLPSTWKVSITRWAKLKLPTNQTARTRWKEEASQGLTRCSRNVMVCTLHSLQIMKYTLQNTELGKPLAMVACYGPRNEGLFQKSSKTYWTVQHLRANGIKVIDIKSITSVVMMAPDPRYSLFFRDGTEKDRWFLMQKPMQRISAMLDLSDSENGELVDGA
ncbi:hypothetical protein BDQ17DRAFT_1394725 [Cyathus striatus]|nr:hypothetical protein BDQ17DRAFT_1394725 [Cyathus striatus]